MLSHELADDAGVKNTAGITPTLMQCFKLDTGTVSSKIKHGPLERTMSKFNQR